MTVLNKIIFRLLLLYLSFQILMFKERIFYFSEIKLSKIISINNKGYKGKYTIEVYDGVKVYKINQYYYEETDFSRFKTSDKVIKEKYDLNFEVYSEGNREVIYYNTFPRWVVNILLFI